MQVDSLDDLWFRLGASRNLFLVFALSLTAGVTQDGIAVFRSVASLLAAGRLSTLDQVVQQKRRDTLVPVRRQHTQRCKVESGRRLIVLKLAAQRCYGNVTEHSKHEPQRALSWQAAQNELVEACIRPDRAEQNRGSSLATSARSIGLEKEQTNLAILFKLR